MNGRPPYRAAAGVALAVLLGYLVSLAPSVTFWDAGEFIAAMKILGIPHPPGTPLFVLMGHVWGMLFPVGEYAFRTNLLSALFSAAGAGCWFLVLDEAAGRVLGPATGRTPLRLAAAAAGALIAAFGFTNWLNSNETEVYAVATFAIGAVCWLLLRWRSARGTDRASRYLLLVAYLLGIAIGNHLLGLLVGPAAVAFVAAELRLNPAPDPVVRRHEWGDAAVLAGLWTLLTGIGLGSPGLILLGAVAFAAALAVAARAGEFRFALLMLGIALVGVTPYLYLFIRSAQHPMLNEAAPESWNALLAVIRRAQYPPRTPFDDPTQLHGPENTGRTLTLVGLQLINYLQYFDWQWAKAIPGGIPVGKGELPFRTFFTLFFLTLGMRGLAAQWRSDRSGAWLLLALFLTTGLGLVAYMNFKPGYSMGFDRFPQSDQHEVRERDYFFVVSFVVWGLWAGLGLLTLAREWLERLARAGAGAAESAGSRRLGRPPVVPYLVFAVALIPFALNFREADRHHGPDARLPGDFAYDLLNSAPPYGILFTYGDNDTFPLWWAQEVAGIRRDVTVVCLALAETDWYMRQLRDNPVRPFDEAAAPAVWRGLHPVMPSGPGHTMTDQDIAGAIPQVLPSAVTLQIGPYRTTLPERTVLYGKDFLVLRMIQQNFGKRPLVWAVTALGNSYGLDRFMVQRGIVVSLETAAVDTTSPNIDLRRMMGTPLDLAASRRLVTETYRFADLLRRTGSPLETTSAAIASTLGLPFTQLAVAYASRGDTTTALHFLPAAAALSRNPAIAGVLRQVANSLPSIRP